MAGWTVAASTGPEGALAQEGIEEIVGGERERILAPIYDLIGWTPPWTVDLLIGILVVVLAWHLAKVVVRASGRPVAKRFERPSITRTVLAAIRGGILVASLVIAGLIVGFRPSELFLSVTIFSAVLAVVLAPLVGRFISGFFVLADRPFEIGDMIELVDEDIRGFVEDVTLRYTKLFTLENTLIVVPNSTMVERDVINYSAEDERTRQRVDVVVTYEGDLGEAMRLLQEAAVGVQDVITGGPPIRVGSALYPAEPTSRIESFADDGIHLSLRYWVIDPYRLPAVRSSIQERFWAGIADADVEIAYPHQHLLFDHTSGELAVNLDVGPDAGNVGR